MQRCCCLETRCATWPTQSAVVGLVVVVVGGLPLLVGPTPQTTAPLFFLFTLLHYRHSTMGPDPNGRVFYYGCPVLCVQYRPLSVGTEKGEQGPVFAISLGGEKKARLCDCVSNRKMCLFQPARRPTPMCSLLPVSESLLLVGSFSLVGSAQNPTSSNTCISVASYCVKFSQQGRFWVFFLNTALFVALPSVALRHSFSFSLSLSRGVCFQTRVLRESLGNDAP